MTLLERPEPAAGVVEELGPTGLRASELSPLKLSDLEALGTWHASVAGADEGRPWWPAAVRGMPLEKRLALASDPFFNLAWQRGERERVADEPAYFVPAYGHVQGGVGEPEPFALWPEQVDVLEDLIVEPRVIVLKARQLGLTWLAVHYGVWLMAFARHTPRAKVLALSKKGEDASKLLARARRILSLLPPYLRVPESSTSARSLTRLKLEQRGELVSLMGTPDQARSETATYAIVDEAAFIRNGNAQATFTALFPALNEQGQAVLISTGNGPAEAPGDGQAFAKKWTDARKGEEAGWKTIFLPTSVHPGRDEAFYKRARKDYLAEEDFLAEYPETEEQALAGKSGLKVFSAAGINAAEVWGRHFDALLGLGPEHPPPFDLEPLEAMPPPIEDTLVTTADFGNFTHTLILWFLESGGVYVTPGEVCPFGEETGAIAEITTQNVSKVQEHHSDGPWPKVRVLFYDAAGSTNAQTWRRTVAESPALLKHWETEEVWNRRTRRKESVPRVRGVPFKDYKDLGKDYLTWLFKRTGEGKAVGIIAISPQCTELLRQTRAVEARDDGTGKIDKEGGDDHGVDSLIAGVAKTAEGHMARVEREKEPPTS